MCWTETETEFASEFTGNLSGQPGVYRFNVLDGMLSVGDNEFLPTEKNGAPDRRSPGAEIKIYLLRSIRGCM